MQAAWQSVCLDEQGDKPVIRYSATIDLCRCMWSAAAVDEAEMANLYVVAHAYTARSIERCVRNGVRSIEHGNLLDDPRIALMKEKGAFLVPTLATYHALA